MFSFNFVLKGEATGGIKLFGKNEEEDVEIVAKEISSAADDTKILEQFIFVGILTFFLPHVLLGIPDIVFGRFSIGEVVNWLFWIVATSIVFRYISVVSNIIAQAIIKYRTKEGPTISVGEISATGSPIIIASQVSDASQKTDYPAS